MSQEYPRVLPPLFQWIWLNSSEGRSSFWGTSPYEPSLVVTLASEVVTVHPERTPKLSRCLATSQSPRKTDLKDVLNDSFTGICTAFVFHLPHHWIGTHSDTLGTLLDWDHHRVGSRHIRSHQQRACRNWMTFIIRHGSNLWFSGKSPVSQLQGSDNVDYKPLIRDSHVTMVSFEQKLLKDFEDRVNKNEKNHLEQIDRKGVQYPNSSSCSPFFLSIWE